MDSGGLSGQFWSAVLVAALVASVGLWWFRLVLKRMDQLQPATRFGVYALVWLAYFILVIIVIGQTG